ncbi:MAG: type II toxin-antitoxin system PemK/MazF family toxin [Planctomycetes bacterium]|nr:type II toxin-antitoxin system PemK/MazF family toxin [Planctomycetota bacterium]
MTVQRGDVVLVDYPYSDRTGSKIRPCLVVQNDRNNQRLDDTIVVTISRTTHAVTEPTQLLIETSSPAGKQSGLLFTSAIQCENVLTVDRQFILRKIGSLPAAAMRQVDDCLKASLGLP